LKIGSAGWCLSFSMNTDFSFHTHWKLSTDHPDVMDLHSAVQASSGVWCTRGRCSTIWYGMSSKNPSPCMKLTSK
jgi:hypothetical protein